MTTNNYPPRTTLELICREIGVEYTVEHERLEQQARLIVELLKVVQLAESISALQRPIPEIRLSDRSA